MKHYLIVIPYLASAAQGRELEYAIAGWRKHFKENYLIAITGEHLPPIESSDLVCIESKRVDAIPGQYRQHLDYVSCFRKVRAAFPDTEGFIFVADDCYAINDFSFADVECLKYIPGGIDYDPNSPNEWRRDAMKTKRMLDAIGFPSRNFTTHLPQWIEWDKLEYLWGKYDLDHESCVFEDLYYNYYYPVSGAVAIDGDDPYKCSVTTTRPDAERLKRAFSEKIWINNNPDGWCPLLDAMLREHYGL